MRDILSTTILPTACSQLLSLHTLSQKPTTSENVVEHAIETAESGLVNVF